MFHFWIHDSKILKMQNLTLNQALTSFKAKSIYIFPAPGISCLKLEVEVIKPLMQMVALGYHNLQDINKHYLRWLLHQVICRVITLIKNFLD